ncbi:MAG TPA: prepilin-type N-terminal cleavage/methylation domain-containing protein [Pyrinomonadaceae bacterium]|nr:prepilin-type N-terminal cleavage/methylation domain-containing protein [Pyrinomonadaceae bacterium]
MKIKLSFAKFKGKAGKFNPLRAFRSNGSKEKSGQSGFSLVEVTVAMTILLVAVLGVFISFAFAVSYNAGNSSRAQALAILQQKVEQMRSAKFTPTVTDSTLTGGTKPAEVVTASDGNKYRIQVVVNNDPLAEGKTELTTRFKEVSVTVTLERPTPGWQTAIPATIILRRVRGN